MIERSSDLDELIDLVVEHLRHLLYMYKDNAISLQEIKKHSKIKIEFLEQNIAFIKYINKKKLALNLLFKYKKIL